MYICKFIGANNPSVDTKMRVRLVSNPSDGKFCRGFF